ncbi:hypothetical protein B0H14DRAFT_2577417 [Mycena olivaceomarginata]|nr:hypothetical protein B0H14DRAFT_2577417 [Mycena olivaceomarginata]
MEWGTDVLALVHGSDLDLTRASSSSQWGDLSLGALSSSWSYVDGNGRPQPPPTTTASPSRQTPADTASTTSLFEPTDTGGNCDDDDGPSGDDSEGSCEGARRDRDRNRTYGIRLRVDTNAAQAIPHQSNGSKVVMVSIIFGSPHINTSTGIYPAFHRAKKGPVAFVPQIQMTLVRSEAGPFAEAVGIFFFLVQKKLQERRYISKKDADWIYRLHKRDPGVRILCQLSLSFNHAVIKAVKIEPWNEREAECAPFALRPPFSMSFSAPSKSGCSWDDPKLWCVDELRRHYACNGWYRSDNIVGGDKEG